MKKIITIMAISSSFIFSANMFDLNVNKTDLEVNAAINMNNFFNKENTSAYVLNTNYLHTENNDLFKIGLGVYQGYDEIDGLLFGFGLNTVFAEDFVAIPFFAHAIYVLPFMEYFPKTSLSAKVLYSPEVLSFSDASQYTEIRTEVDFDIINSMSIYGGYRNISTDYINYDYKMSDSFYGGLKYSF